MSLNALILYLLKPGTTTATGTECATWSAAPTEVTYATINQNGLSLKFTDEYRGRRSSYQIGVIIGTGKLAGSGSIKDWYIGNIVNDTSAKKRLQWLTYALGYWKNISDGLSMLYFWNTGTSAKDTAHQFWNHQKTALDDLYCVIKDFDVDENNSHEVVVNISIDIYWKKA